VFVNLFVIVRFASMRVASSWDLMQSVAAVRRYQAAPTLRVGTRLFFLYGHPKEAISPLHAEWRHNGSIISHARGL
jgi:hypothetical protein